MFARLREAKPGPRRELHLDRDFYALVAVYSRKMTEKAVLGMAGAGNEGYNRED